MNGKKWMMIALTAAMLLGLCACGDGGTAVFVQSVAELEKYDAWIDNFTNYEEDETGSNSIISHGISLHAKIFIAKFRFDGDRYSYNNWFIGSTNCTQAGLKYNYEAQVQLRSLEQGTSAKEVLNSLLNPDAPLITSYKVKEQSVIDPEEEKNRQIQRELIFNLSHLDFLSIIISEKADAFFPFIF